MIFLKSDLVTQAGWRDKAVLSRRWEWRDKVDTFNMSWQTPSERLPLPSAPKRANVAHLVTPMHVARQRVFVTPRKPARPNGLDLQIYISGWVIFKIKLKNRLKKFFVRHA